MEGVDGLQGSEGGLADSSLPVETRGRHGPEIRSGPPRCQRLEVAERCSDPGFDLVFTLKRCEIDACLHGNVQQSPDHGCLANGATAIAPGLAAAVVKPVEVVFLEEDRRLPSGAPGRWDAGVCRDRVGVGCAGQAWPWRVGRGRTLGRLWQPVRSGSGLASLRCCPLWYRRRRVDGLVDGLVEQGFSFRH